MGGRGRGPKLLHFPEFPGFFFRFFFNEPTAQTARPIFVVNGSNNVVPCKVIAFGVHIYIRNSFGGHFPQKPPFLAHFRQIAPVCELRARTAIQTKPVDQILKGSAQITFYDLSYNLPAIFFRFPN